MKRNTQVNSDRNTACCRSAVRRYILFPLDQFFHFTERRRMQGQGEPRNGNRGTRALKANGFIVVHAAQSHNGKPSACFHPLFHYLVFIHTRIMLRLAFAGDNVDCGILMKKAVMRTVNRHAGNKAFPCTRKTKVQTRCQNPLLLPVRMRAPFQEPACPCRKGRKAAHFSFR